MDFNFCLSPEDCAGSSGKGIKLYLVDVLKGLSTSYPSYLKFVRPANRLLPYYEKAGFTLCFQVGRYFVDMFRGEKERRR